MKELGKLVKQARERRGYTTQQQAADAIGMTLSKFNRLENGVTKELPVPDDLHRIGEALGLSVEEMLVAAGYLEVPSSDDDGMPPVRNAEERAFYAALAEYLPALGEAQRRHLVETARMMTDAAIRRAPTPASSSPAADAPAGTPPGPSPSR